MRINPHQRFACSQCGRCCRGFDVVVTAAEADRYRRQNVAAWFDGGDGVGKGDPFETVPGLPGAQRIRKRADGACGFLSSDNRCRIHEELGAAQKPLTCRAFPFNFHSAPDGVIVTASFNCPTIVANVGPLISEGATRAGLDLLRQEWFAAHRAKPIAVELVKGRPLSTRSLLLLRRHLLAMLAADDCDLRSGVRRIAATLDDLTRNRVRSLADAEFAEYLSLTVPHAAANLDAPPPHNGGAIARMLQYGFLYAVVAIRESIEHPSQSRTRLRLRRLRLLAHFHRLAPGLDRVNVKALRRRRVDINDDEVRPIVFHYLRGAIETLGASGRAIVDELSMAVSYLNAACALAAMHADADGTTVDRAVFIRALTEASDVAHAQHPILDAILRHFSGGTDALLVLAKQEGAAN